MAKYNIIISFLAALALEVSAVAAQDGALAGRLEKHVYTLADDSMAGRKTGSREAETAAQYISDRFREIGIEPCIGDSYLQPFVPDMLLGPSDKKCNNVVGVIRGSAGALNDEYIVVGAHYDHIGTDDKKSGDAIYNGADDNASGVAALIELGRNLYGVRDKLKRNVILVAFDAEEAGLLGSRYFAGNPPVPLDDIRLMMSIDMVGWLSKSGCLYYYGTGTISHGRNTVTKHNIVPEGLRIEAKRFENNMLVATDTEPFAVRGVPTLHVTTGKKSPYHKPEDKAALIDYQGLAIITEHLTGVVELFSTDEEFEASGQRSYKHRDYDRRVEFGITAAGGVNSLRYSSGPFRGKTAPSFGAGAFMQVNMGTLGLRPQLLYERNGAQYPDGRLWTNSLTVPVSLIIQTPKSFVGGMYAGLGGYYRYAFDGTAGGAKINFSETFRRHEGGIQWGLGMWLYHISVGVNFRYGLTDLLRDPAGEPNIRNRSTQLSVSYIF